MRYKNKIVIILIMFIGICFSQTTDLYLQKAYLGNGIWKKNVKITLEHGKIKEITKYDSLPKYGNYLDLSVMTALPGLVNPLQKIDLNNSFEYLEFIEMDKLHFDYTNELNPNADGICTYLCYSLGSYQQISTLQMYPKSDLQNFPNGLVIDEFSPFSLLIDYNRVHDYGEFVINNFVSNVNIHHFLNYKLNNLLLKNLFQEMPLYLLVNKKSEIIQMSQQVTKFKYDFIISHNILNAIPDSSKYLIFAVLFEDTKKFAEYLNTTEKEKRTKFTPLIKNYSNWTSTITTIKKELDKEYFIDVMTNIPAKLFRIERHFGEIKVNQNANMIFFSNNPFTQKQKIVSVMVNGKIIIE